MTPAQPMTARPLVPLTLAVLAVHLLALRQGRLHEAPRPVPMRTLITRVVTLAETTLHDKVQERVLQDIETATRSPIPRRAQPLPRAAAPEPPPLIDTAPAPAPASAPAPAPATPPMAFAIPGSMRISYDVAGRSRGQTWTTAGQLLWRHDGSQYEAQLDYSTPSMPSRIQQSTGRITAQGLEPLRFSDRSRSEQATHFQRDSGTLVFSSNAPQLPLLPGAQDRVSMFLQIAAMVAAAPAKFDAGAVISLQTAGTRDAPPWLFTVEGDEQLLLPGGTVSTRKLLRVPVGDYDMRVEMWLGTGMDYVPVRIRLTQPNGDYVDQQWSSTDRL